MSPASRWSICGLLVASMLVVGCAGASGDPCEGEPDECREAIEASIDRLGPDGRGRVRDISVRPENDCRLIDPSGERGCPDEVVYAVRVVLDMDHEERFPVINMVVAEFRGEDLTVTWDDRHPGQ